jgi:hypothetical protein
VKYRYVLVREDGDLAGTNDAGLAAKAASWGVGLVYDLQEGMSLETPSGKSYPMTDLAELDDDSEEADTEADDDSEEE